MNERLQRFSHVNKKAFEQYLSFHDQQDELTRRQRELEEAGVAIEQLSEHLEQRKDDAIQRTFKQVALQFQEVFAQLAPGGGGQLRLVASAAARANTTAAGVKVDSYEGVSIRVSFTQSSPDQMQPIQLLSGGQKSLVALALIFAIQKCDPAPFYLFDEIDANLDAVARANVAAMIHRLSDRAQFISTTFRVEQVQLCSRVYGVRFASGMSTVTLVTKEAAQDFLQNDETPAQ